MVDGYSVILSPSPPVILSEAKNLVVMLRINSAKNLNGEISYKKSLSAPADSPGLRFLACKNVEESFARPVHTKADITFFIIHNSFTLSLQDDVNTLAL